MSVPDILRRIVDATRAELAEHPIDETAMTREAEARDGRRQRFREALTGGSGPRIIAEIKAASPSAGVIVDDPDVTEIARSYRDGGAAALSVVTEPRFFLGRREWLGVASGAADLPVIMKDFVIEPSQVVRGIAAGADAILLLASILDAAMIRECITVASSFGRDALVEVHDESELERAIEAGAALIGVNNRDLRDFSVSLETSERLAASIPAGVTKVAESGIGSHDDVVRLEGAGFDAFLVGESLLRSDDRVEAVRRLRGVTR